MREVLEQIDRDLAYTTIATVLGRLRDKGRVVRHKDGGSWRYRATRTREAALASEVSRILEDAPSATEPLLVAFLDRVEEVDPAALDRLEALIRARRGNG